VKADLEALYLENSLFNQEKVGQNINSLNRRLITNLAPEKGKHYLGRVEQQTFGRLFIMHQSMLCNMVNCLVALVIDSTPI